MLRFACSLVIFDDRTRSGFGAAGSEITGIPHEEATRLARHTQMRVKGKRAAQ